MVDLVKNKCFTAEQRCNPILLEGLADNKTKLTKRLKLTHSHTMTPFDAPGKRAFWKHCGFQNFRLFPQCFEKGSCSGSLKARTVC